MLDVKKSRPKKVEKAKLLSIAGEKTKIKFSHAGTVRGNLDVKMPKVVRQGHKQACVSGVSQSQARWCQSSGRSYGRFLEPDAIPWVKQ